ncbi:MAG: hypothetical protein AABX98_05880 [Nanoarchaeota archaeon]
MPKNTLVLFDIGCVLIKLNFKGFYEAAAKVSKQNATMIEKAYATSTLEIDAVEGRIKDQEYCDELKKLIEPRREVSQKELEEIMKHLWPRMIQECIDIKRELANAGYAVGIFSNIGESGHRLLEEKFPEIFETYNPHSPKIFSYKVKAMKPKEPMYREMQGYKRVILIDDKDNYLRVGIEQFGWYGIHFTEYIDSHEPLRILHQDSGWTHQHLITATSAMELRKGLDKFGVKIDTQ